MMTMTITITPADLPLQLQWYAWIEFLQLLPCHCCLRRQHSYLQSYHTPSLILPYSLLPSVFSKLSSDSHINFVYVSHPLLSFLKNFYEVPEPIKLGVCCLKNVKILHSMHTKISKQISGAKNCATLSMSQSSSHVCPTTVTSHYTAFLSHPIGCDAISPNGERMRRCWRGGTTLGPPWGHLGTTRTTESQKVAFSGRVTGFYH